MVRLCANNVNVHEFEPSAIYGAITILSSLLVLTRKSLYFSLLF